MSTQIRAAQFLNKEAILCVGADGKRVEIAREPSVKAFIETKLKRGQINDTTVIYHQGKVETVAALKKQLKIGGFWARLFGW